MSEISIQRTIDERLNAESHREQLDEFQKSIIVIPTGNITGFCSIDDLVENERRRAKEPGINSHVAQECVDMSIEAASHLKKFGQIATRNSLMPENEYKWTINEDRQKLFGGKKRVTRHRSIRAWDITYDYDDGYPRGFHLTPSGLIDTKRGWFPSKYSGCETLVKSLADVLIRAGITKVD